MRENLLRKWHHAEVWRRERSLPDKDIRAGGVENELHVFPPRYKEKHGVFREL